METPYTNSVIQIPVSDAQFAAAGKRLRPYGVELTGPTGTLSRSGVTARYTHANGLLTLEIIDRPFLLPLSLIESKLKDYIEKALVEDPTLKSTSETTPTAH